MNGWEKHIKKNRRTKIQIQRKGQRQWEAKKERSQILWWRSGGTEDHWKRRGTNENSLQIII